MIAKQTKPLLAQDSWYGPRPHQLSTYLVVPRHFTPHPFFEASDFTITLGLLLWTGDRNLSTILVHHRRSSRTESGTLMEASKLPHFRKSCIFSSLHYFINYRSNPHTRLNRNKIPNNFCRMSNGTHFHFPQFSIHWSDHIDFPVSQRNNHVYRIQPKPQEFNSLSRL